MIAKDQKRNEIYYINLLRTNNNIFKDELKNYLFFQKSNKEFFTLLEDTNKFV